MLEQHKNEKQNSLFIRAASFITSPIGIILGGLGSIIMFLFFIGPAVHSWFTADSSLYEKNTYARPYIELNDKPVIDSIILTFDSLETLKYIEAMNSIDSSIYTHAYYPEATVYFSLVLSNSGNYTALRQYEVISDSITKAKFLRDNLSLTNVYLLDAIDPFSWTTLPPKSKLTRVKFSHKLNFHKDIHDRGYGVIHALLYYSNEYDVLFDTYLLFSFGYRYPEYLITSQRNSWRVLDPAPLRYVTTDVWIKDIAQTSNSYEYEKAKDVMKHFDYLFYRYREEENYILGK